MTSVATAADRHQVGQQAVKPGVTRHVYAEVPPRVVYELTALGRTLHAPLRTIGTWAEEHIVEVLEAREAYDARVQPTKDDFDEGADMENDLVRLGR